MTRARGAGPAGWEVASGVWLAVAATEALAPGAHRDDVAQSRGMPPWRAREFCAGRGLVRSLLARAAVAGTGGGVRPAPDVRIVRDAEGRPLLEGHAAVHLSVSHDAGTVAAAVAFGRPVGVDVQHPDGRIGAGLARRCLRSGAARLNALPAVEAARELAWVWTAQEACVKAAGQGLAGRPWEIDVPLGARQGRWRQYRWLSLRDLVATPLSCAFPEPGPQGRWEG